MLPEPAQVRVDSSLSETGGWPLNSGIPACDYREDGQVQLVHQVVDEQAVPELRLSWITMGAQPDLVGAAGASRRVSLIRRRTPAISLRSPRLRRR